jgi:hypothetical protein
MQTLLAGATFCQTIVLATSPYFTRSNPLTGRDGNASIYEAAHPMGFDLLDHLIIGNGQLVLRKERGLGFE